ncbi:MAG: L,D-transpeptidase family protein [Bacillota bacterium]|nr:L,D-transpeptidase family protein [Bacillota bacterium]
MKTRLILTIFGAVLLLVSAVQISIDYMKDKNISDREAAVSKKADYCIFIEVEDKTLYLLDNGKCIKQYPVASGKSGYPSPLGYWRITEKGDWGEGFGGRWMGLNVPWGTYGIHGTLSDNSIGTPASAGCIRMFNEDVAELYNIVPVGTPVVIVNGSFGPFGRGFSDIFPGDTGADVLEIQRRLKDLGYYKGSLDGRYEDEMKKALHQFQKDHKLEVKNELTKDDWLAMGFREFE